MTSRLDLGVQFANELRQGAQTALGWSNLPSPLNAHALAAGGFSSVLMDGQHGLFGEAELFAGCRSIHQAGGFPAVRIPVGRVDVASRALDAGCQMIVAPMINTPQDAAALVAATKYPSIGERSWGPAAALDLWEATADAYLAMANTLVVTLAMIETMQAMENLEAILKVPGIDGVFVGPSDLSLTLSDGARLEPLADGVIDRVSSIGNLAKAAGKIAAVYAFDADKAKAYLDRGFTLAAVGSDALALRTYAAQALAITGR